MADHRQWMKVNALRATGHTRSTPAGGVTTWTSTASTKKLKRNNDDEPEKEMGKKEVRI